MNSKELREKYLDFYKKNGHAIIPGASLVPQNDPTVLFTTAGMHPLVPFLLGEKHPAGKRLTDVQKCIRTGDIDEVGDNTHLTFFEMLGNWSLGDAASPDGVGAGYWKKEAITFSFDFLTKELGLPLEKLAFTCFAGDDDAPKDEESAQIWMDLGVSKDRIVFLPKKDNWWGPAGQTGPCGPDTEMFYWTGKNKAPKAYNPEDKNWVEIWNDVFMQYVKDENGKYLPAAQKNVDTGMGLERTLMALEGKENVYETDLFEGIMELIPNAAELDERKRRIIADHTRAIAFLISDGVIPSNKDRGYVLRRLIRRISAYEFLAKTKFLDKLLRAVCDKYNLKSDELVFEFNKEINKFSETLELGTKEYMKIKNIDVKSAFLLYQSFGLSFDIIKELDSQKTKDLKYEDFEKELKSHQELSRTASAGMFKGGLADASVETTRLHTVAHLMLAALRKVLGVEVLQKGSNITSERLRFDFSYSQKLTPEQIKQVEEVVNRAIVDKLVVEWKEEDLETARHDGAMGVFGEKYGERVKVYTIYNKKTGEVFSKEICGGPHVQNTSELGEFKILKEESSSAGVRRIKAVLK